MFLLLCILSLIGVAQEPTDSALAKMAERARLFGERIPQEHTTGSVPLCTQTR
jgi:hypothetical protein